jgi:hypothetical protein
MPSNHRKVAIDGDEVIRVKNSTFSFYLPTQSLLIIVDRLRSRAYPSRLKSSASTSPVTVDDTMILAHPDLERWPTTIESQSSITDPLPMVGASVAHFARRAYGTTVSVKSLLVPPV